jgi:ADP-L-glycero-D-manno-heptose 6-epimerase
MTIIVTGAAGFIGSNIVLGLNHLGHDHVIAVDDLTDSAKFKNLSRTRISDYIDHTEFYSLFQSGALGRVDAVFHQGACSDTMEYDGRYMMQANYRCSKQLMDTCVASGIPLFYASSAATYGNSAVFREEAEWESPLNVYGYSKLLFDNVARPFMATSAASQIVGFRYFNVYGPGEQHKGRMASVAFHQFNRLKSGLPIELFGPYGGYDAGEQRRDFIHVDDVVAVNLWAFSNPDVRGVFNLGTGHAQTFNDVARAAIDTWRKANKLIQGQASVQKDNLQVRYIDFPVALKGKYQSFTQADLTRLRVAGYDREFLTVEQGVKKYVNWLIDQEAAPIPS